MITTNLQSDEVTAQRDLLLLASYGFKYKENIYLGSTVKLGTSRLVERESAHAYALDAGFLYVLPEKSLSITGAVQNIGASSKFIDKANPLPFSAFLGAGYLKEWKEYFITPGFDITYLFEEERMVPELGFEFGRDPYSINAGIKFNVEEAKWHLGFTVLKDKYDIAYAYLPGIRLDSTHRLSIGVRFGSMR